MVDNKKTTGTQVYEALTSGESMLEYTYDDLAHNLMKNYWPNLEEAVERGINLYGNSFFIDVECKNERVQPGMFRHYFIPVLACPTPHFDQTVYTYDKVTNKLEILWAVPDKGTCLNVLQNYLEMPTEDKWIAQNIVDYVNGKLMRIAKALNKEKAGLVMTPDNKIIVA